MDDLMKHLKMPERVVPVKHELLEDDAIASADAFLNNARHLLAPAESTQLFMNTPAYVPSSAAATLEKQQAIHQNGESKMPWDANGVHPARADMLKSREQGSGDVSSEVNPSARASVRGVNAEPLGAVGPRRKSQDEMGGIISAPTGPSNMHIPSTGFKVGVSIPQSANPIMNLNNLAMQKKYRITYDVFKKTGTDRYYGHLYIGQHMFACLEGRIGESHNARDAKWKLAELGVDKVRKLKAAPAHIAGPMGFEIAQLPPEPPPGYERVVVPKSNASADFQASEPVRFAREIALPFSRLAIANRVANSALVANNTQPGVGPVNSPVTGPRPHLLDGKEYNWTSLFYEWLNTRSTKIARPEFTITREPATHLKPLAECGHTAFVTIPEFNMKTFGSGKKYLPDEKLAKQLAAKNAVYWLVDERHLNVKTIEGGHIRKRKDAPNDSHHAGERAAKRPHVQSHDDERRRESERERERDKERQQMRDREREEDERRRNRERRERDRDRDRYDDDHRRERSRNRDRRDRSRDRLRERPRSSDRYESKRESSRDRAKDRDAVKATSRTTSSGHVTPRSTEATASSNSMKPANGMSVCTKLDPGALTQVGVKTQVESEDLKERVLRLAKVLGFNPPKVYCMPADPTRWPNSIFNGSIHFPGHVVDGTDGGAVVHIKELGVAGSEEMERLLWKRTCEFLEQQQADREKALEEQLKQLRELRAAQDVNMEDGQI